MAILMMESFRSYPTTADMFSTNGRGGPWTTLSGSDSISYNSFFERPTWRADATSLRAFSRRLEISDKNAPQRDFTSGQSVKSVCAQFICGGSTDANAQFTEQMNFCLFQEPIPEVAPTVNLNNFYGVSLSTPGAGAVGDSSRPAVYYTILTAATGTVNRLLLGYLRPWKHRTHYHVELKVDHTNPVARIIIYVNGVLEMDMTYDRDRIDNGFQTRDFKRILLGNSNPSAGPQNAPAYSNVVIDLLPGSSLAVM